MLRGVRRTRPTIGRNERSRGAESRQPTTSQSARFHPVAALMTGSGRYVCHDPGVSDAVIRIAQTRCEMFLSQAVAQAVHADRVRDLERAARERRLVPANDANVARAPG